jgi:maltooligosyltrehalose trehalohydrolase
MTLPDTDTRLLPVGAELQGGHGVHFRVWAPKRKMVEVVLDGAVVRLTSEDNGYFSGLAAEAKAGARYRYRLDNADAFPDPASRYQPEGPHGPSEVVDPSFDWSDTSWRGVRLPGQVIYELHAGSFTREGTLDAAARQLDELARLGVTVIELMPLAEFPGGFNWGYDGVDLYAPAHVYGKPDALRRFVDRAHSLGIGVILDVVYNHLGPEGNYLSQFSDAYFTGRYTTDWGPAINYDGENSRPVREFFVSNACYWITEFHLDGLRFDATDCIYDKSPRHILAEMVHQARQAANGRSIILIGENEAQQTRLIRDHGLDALWNDDFHHSAMVAMTGRDEAYYTDYRGAPQEFVSAVKYGYLYQGQRYKWQRKRRGSPALDLPPAAFVTFIQNHDQVANSARGLRCHAMTSPGRYRALTALMLLAPGTPMLFQGQEFAASAPFFFFADHNGRLRQIVRGGRQKFMRQFPGPAQAEMADRLPDPSDPSTFERCRLDHGERETHAQIYQMHRDLLRLRRSEPALRAQSREAIDGAVLSSQSFLLRYFQPGDEDLLLIVNLGRSLHLDPAPEPLLAPPYDRRWSIIWSSEDPRYGGSGTPPPDTQGNWQVLAESAILLRSASMTSDLPDPFANPKWEEEGL